MSTLISQFFTTKEVAAVLKLSTQTVYRMERDGELEGTRVGGSLRFSAEAVEALLKRGSKQ